MHLHDKMVPTYKEVRSTMKECFPAIPSKDRDQLAKAQRRLLAEECMKDLCKDLGYAMPERLTTEQSTAGDNMPQPTLQFKLVGPEGSDEDLPERPDCTKRPEPKYGHKHCYRQTGGR